MLIIVKFQLKKYRVLLTTFWYLYFVIIADGMLFSSALKLLKLKLKDLA